MTRHYRVHGVQRGAWTFGPARLLSGDMFGFDVREATRADDSAACCAVASGEFAWGLADPRAVTRVSFIGRLGLYEVELSTDELGL